MLSSSMEKTPVPRDACAPAAASATCYRRASARRSTQPAHFGRAPPGGTLVQSPRLFQFHHHHPPPPSPRQCLAPCRCCCVPSPALGPPVHLECMFLPSLRLSEHLRRPLCCRAICRRHQDVTCRWLCAGWAPCDASYGPRVAKFLGATICHAHLAPVAGPAASPACGLCPNAVWRSAGFCVPALPSDCAASALLFYTHTTSVARPAFRAAGVPHFFSLYDFLKTTLGGRGLITPC